MSVPEPIDVQDALREERRVFDDLLRSLDADDWRRPTECPAYDVQGVAAHVLGDDLSLLSRQRDGAVPGTVPILAEGVPFREALDRFNDTWVATVAFFSPALLVDLLVVSGDWTADFYGAVDPMSPGEWVGFFGGPGPTSPYWQSAAREYVERWVHHHQILRALDRPGIDDATLLERAAVTIARALGGALRDVDRGVALALDGIGAWPLSAGPTEATLRLAGPDVPHVLSRGRTPAEVEAAFTVEGDEELGRRVAAAIAAMAGR